MNLQEFTSGTPATKPWLSLVAGNIAANNISLDGRVNQELIHPTPYGLWASFGAVDPTSTLNGNQPLMGSFAGGVTIPSASIAAGMTVRVKVSGLFTTAGGSVVVSLQNLGGTFTYASSASISAAGVVSEEFFVDFDIQVSQLGAAGVGIQRFFATSQLLNQLQVPVAGKNTTTFDSTVPMELVLYVNTVNATIVRHSCYATVLY
jgi:hypothetical protein